KNNITPESIRKNIKNILDSVYEKDHVTIGNRNLEYQETVSIKKQIKEFEKEMLEAASQLEFEEAAKLRDKIKRIEVGNLGIISTNFSKN
ncbi:MAG: UvrB/UvrC motif-containing protein, partial [Pseudomonadota bacterium]|nr:UvrB/UvrC motif-containing protein [Pseudomonadota bacterium]